MDWVTGHGAMVVGEPGMSFPENRCPPDHALAPTATPPPAGVPPRNERPVRGDNRTGQSHMGRLGWMGARAEYSHGEELPAPTHIGRRRAGARSKRPAIFFNPKEAGFRRRDTYCPAVRRLSPESDFSDAMVATGGSSARVPGNSFGSKAFSPVFIARVAASLGGSSLVRRIV